MLTESEKTEQARKEMKHSDSKFEKLIKAKPKLVTMSQEILVKTDYLQSGQTLPLVVRPNIDGAEPIAWAKSNYEFIERELLKHGAILFRGFVVDSASEFERFALAICPELFGEYGDLPREGFSGKVYGSTPYPADQSILFHNESSHLPCWPLKQWFCCLQAAESGGETPIVDCRQVYQRLDPKIRERFREKGVMYVRNFTNGLGVSWQEFFKTTEKLVVEEYCRQVGTKFEWKGDNGLRTRQVCPAVAQHPKTGEVVWFNQVQHWHLACLDRATRESLLRLFEEVELPRNCYYGDGSPIEESVMEEIGNIYWQEAVSFPWQKGDILMIDNMLVAHGRKPYRGTRKIVVAMGEMMSREALLG